MCGSFILNLKARSKVIFSLIVRFTLGRQECLKRFRTFPPVCNSLKNHQTDGHCWMIPLGNFPTILKPPSRTDSLFIYIKYYTNINDSGKIRFGETKQRIHLRIPHHKCNLTTLVVTTHHCPHQTFKFYELEIPERESKYKKTRMLKKKTKPTWDTKNLSITWYRQLAFITVTTLCLKIIFSIFFLFFFMLYKFKQSQI